MVAVAFTDERHSLVKRKISDIRFDDNKFWMEVNILSHSASNGLLNFYDESKKQSHEKPGKGTVPYFNLQFVATDDEYGSATVKLYLCSYDGQGDGFLGSANDCSKNDKKAKDILKKITDQKHSVQVLVESVQAGVSSGDKIFRIIGTYEQLN